jgi:hypothetical protein
MQMALDANSSPFRYGGAGRAGCVRRADIRCREIQRIRNVRCAVGSVAAGGVNMDTAGFLDVCPNARVWVLVTGPRASVGERW